MTNLFRDLAEAPEPKALTRGLWWRRAFMLLFAVVAVLALANVFGQEASTTSARSPAAQLSLRVPERVRGGLLFQARLELHATQDIEHPRLVLDRGWTDGLQINSIEPGPVGETSRDGRLVLTYDKLSAGDHMTLWFQFQADPTATGKRPFDLELDDAEQPLARLDRTLTILP
jgi:hypothetical protein